MELIITPLRTSKLNIIINKYITYKMYLVKIK